jgi:hypothetical protein
MEEPIYHAQIIPFPEPNTMDQSTILSALQEGANNNNPKKEDFISLVLSDRDLRNIVRKTFPLIYPDRELGNFDFRLAVRDREKFLCVAGELKQNFPEYAAIVSVLKETNLELFNSLNYPNLEIFKSLDCSGQWSEASTLPEIPYPEEKIILTEKHLKIGIWYALSQSVFKEAAIADIGFKVNAYQVTAEVKVCNHGVF